jgi:hypothetical protein
MFEVRIPGMCLQSEIQIQLIRHVFLIDRVGVNKEEKTYNTTKKGANLQTFPPSTRWLWQQLQFVLPSVTCDPTTAKDLRRTPATGSQQSFSDLQ